ncbi:hypothetical protein R6Q59_033619 [Mikania micrantha]|uniref:BHLH domain-containing protein n=1 Tax=Mikania micrantha TaxID=192012 RepID=A0A5N6NX26_9ASTR|nr:hypothetical protein E3N88_18314 [Mikania micrantha]
MAQNEAATVDRMAGGSFSQLLFSDIDLEDTDHHSLNTVAGGATRFKFSTDKKTPKMLCFGAVSSTPDQNSTADDNQNSSSPLPITTTSLSSNSNIKRKRGCVHYQSVVLPTTFATTGPPTRTGGTTSKKMRIDDTLPASHAKVKKEKLGERITALQQMVSPYGKSDTASVLHEAMGYIKFLQEQVQVLCSPYLQLQATNNLEGGEDVGLEIRKKKDLRSRGLCLVPVECTLRVGESNGADLWSPAMVNHH